MTDHTGSPWGETDPRGLVAGQPLCGSSGLRAAVVEFRSDWKYHCETFGINHWTKVHPCHECPVAIRGPYLYTDCREPPPWRLHPTRHAALMAMPRFAACPLTQLRGFHAAMIKKCQMHMINMGIGLTINGNALAEMLEEGLYGAPHLPIEHRLLMAHADFLHWCAQRGVPSTQPPFSANSLRNLPVELDAKAYNSRCLTAYFAEATQAAALATPSQHATVRAGVVHALASLYIQLEQAPRFMSQQQADSAADAGIRCLQLFHRLAVEAFRGRRAGRWSIRPKAHKVHHMMRDMKRNSPALIVSGSFGGGQGSPCMAWRRKTMRC